MSKKKLKPIYIVKDNITIDSASSNTKKHYCLKTATGKNEMVGINLITSKKRNQ